MPFTSIDPTHPRNNFCEILVKIAQLLVVVEKLNFFESAIFIFFFKKEKKNASSQFKSVKIYGIPRMGQNFDDYPDFQQKASDM